MSVINPNETAKSWQAHKREPAVQIYLSGVDGDAGALAGVRIAGFPLSLAIVPVSDWIDPEELSAAVAAVIQVDADSGASIKRFEKLARSVQTPLIAAVYDPPLALVRALIRCGAHDVVPLPLDVEELQTSLSPIRETLAGRARPASVRNGKLVCAIKSVGGVGATSLLSQLAILFSESEATYGREACLIDLDVQFGDAAFQLGLRPKLSLLDLVESGSRLDGDLVRATSTAHPSGLNVIASPPEMLPLEAVSSEQIIQIVDTATREFGTVFVDLPTNWTNWSLSVLARSDLVLLVTELGVTGLHRAKRQLDLIDAQELGNLDVRVIANRFEKGMLRTVRTADVKQVLGRDVSYTIADDPQLMRSAIDRGVPLSEIKRKSAIGRDIDALNAGLAAALGLER